MKTRVFKIYDEKGTVVEHFFTTWERWCEWIGQEATELWLESNKFTWDCTT